MHALLSRSDRDDLRDLMQRHGLSSRAVATLVGVHPVTVRRWMTGKARVPQSALMVLESVVTK